MLAPEMPFSKSFKCDFRRHRLRHLYLDESSTSYSIAKTAAIARSTAKNHEMSRNQVIMDTHKNPIGAA